MQTVADVHNDAAARQRAQARMVARHQTPKPEIPGDYGCAGNCSQPAPEPPSGSRLHKKAVPEFFVGSRLHPTHTYTILVSAVVVGALALYAATATTKRR